MWVCVCLRVCWCVRQRTGWVTGGFACGWEPSDSATSNVPSQGGWVIFFLHGEASLLQQIIFVRIKSQKGWHFYIDTKVLTHQFILGRRVFGKKKHVLMWRDICFPLRVKLATVQIWMSKTNPTVCSWSKNLPNWRISASCLRLRGSCANSTSCWYFPAVLPPFHSLMRCVRWDVVNFVSTGPLARLSLLQCRYWHERCNYF